MIYGGLNGDIAGIYKMGGYRKKKKIFFWFKKNVLQ